MREVAEFILRAIASNPDGVRVSSRQEPDEKQQITVEVDPADLGRVIGKQGRTINAVRTVVKAAGLKQQQQVGLDLITPDPAEAG